MEYKVSDLAIKAGVTKRTIHYYISKGLLMPPIGSGVNSLYNDEHLKRINLIKKLQAEYMPLNKIRKYILDNPEVVDDVCIKEVKKHVHSDMYVKENVCDIFEIHCSCDNYEKYSYIIENVKKYVEKMMED